MNREMGDVIFVYVCLDYCVMILLPFIRYGLRRL